MADVAQTETIARTFVPETHKPMRTLTPEQQVRKDRAERIRQRVKDNDPQAAIKEAFGAKDRDRDLGFDSQANLDRRLDTNIPALGTKERKSYQEARDILSASQNLVEGKLKPTDTQFNDLRSEIMVRLNLKGRGFDELKPDEKLAIADRMLTDPEFQSKLRGVLAKTLEEGRPVDEQIKTVEQALKEAQDLYDQKNGEVTTTSDDFKKVDDTLTTEFGKTGAKAVLIESLASQGYDNGSLYDRPINDVVRIVLNPKPPMTPARITTEIAKAQDLKNRKQPMHQDQVDLLELVDEIKKRQQYKDLTAERKELDDKRTELEGRSTTLAKELKTLQDARDAKQIERDDVNNAEKVRQDRVIIDQVKALVGEAAEQYIDGEVEKMAGVWEDILKEEEVGAKSRDAKVLEGFLINGLKEEKFKSGTILNRGGKIETKADYKKVDAAATAFAANPEKYIGDLLKEEFKDITTGLTPDSPEELARKEMERDRIDQKLASDPQFVKDYKAKIAVEIVRAKMISSRFYETGKLTSEQGSAMLSDPDMREAVTAELVKKAYEIEGRTGRTGLAKEVDRLAKANDEHGILWALMLLIGGPMAMVKKVVH